MTTDEIKQSVSMCEVVERYGLHPNRAGFISCPFHNGDRTPSMKIYKRDYHCHACGANGDIFSFVMGMEHCDFKTAFLMLGGEYEKPTLSSRLNVYKAKRAKETRLAKEQRLRQKMSINNLLISVYMRWLNRFEPLSDEWCDTYNALQYQLYIFDELRGTKNA
jgi:DNA primase